MRHEKQSNMKTLWGGVIFWPLFSLIATPFVLATPAHAADDNTVSIAVDQNATLQPTGNLYKATTNVKVTTGKPYGFNLVMQSATESSDLINSSNSTRHIYGANYHNMATELSANQWGYALDKQSNKFTRVPSRNDMPAVIVDTAVKGKQAGCNCKDHCDTTVTFAANIDPAKLASGSYSTAITYTATAKPAPKPPVVDPTVCKSGDPKNDCQVDLDANMIPVKYTGSTTNAQWTSLAKPEDSSNQGEWYNYNNKQWANAVTVKDPSKYKGQTRVVDQSDILGYWVYIPRYAYEVMRRDGTDKPVPAQNFLIHFEKKTDAKRRPAACSTTGKDYRTQCDLDRSYIKGQPSNQGTWATHPAFTFGTKELNGIWFAKFETAWNDPQLTVLPGQSYGNYMHSDIGDHYSAAKSLGVYDPQNVGGRSVFTTQNSHHLAKLSSRMVNNNDWGAATYLSASKYGAGYNGVQINPEQYNAGHNYNTNDGQLTSTTNNPTGIYDMSGGGWEYVAASYTTNLNESGVSDEYGDYFGAKAHPPYVNTYNFSNPNSCTFSTCGGQALYETSQWSCTSFVTSSLPWFGRSGYYSNGSCAGLFYADSYFGAIIKWFRVALTPAPHD